jgi:hypothetical protein
VVRQIFSEYVAGNSPHRIAASLNAHQIPSPRGGQWNASTINGDGAMDTVRQKLSDLEVSKANILRSMDQDTSPTKVEPHRNIGQLYQRRVEQLSHLLDDESSQQEAVTIIRLLIDRIEITPGKKRGDPQVQLVGGLAAILSWRYPSNKKTAIQRNSGFFVCVTLLVAGAGFAQNPTIAMWL